jgi:hypothetical protein
MATSVYIVVEGEDPGFDIFVNGRAIARYENALEQIALRLRVRPLLEFFSADQDSMAVVMEQKNVEWGTMLPRPQWFIPQEGLETVHALHEFLLANPAALGSETPLVVLELQDFEKVLRKTGEHELRWHLAVSFR